MTDPEKMKLLYSGAGLLCGWLIGGLVNILWFFCSVQVLGYGEHAPGWYIGIRDVLRPAVLLLSMAAGYMIARQYFRRTREADGSEDRGC